VTQEHAQSSGIEGKRAGPAVHLLQTHTSPVSGRLEVPCEDEDAQDEYAPVGVEGLGAPSE